MHILFDLRTVDDHFPGISRYAYEMACALNQLPQAPRLTTLLMKSARSGFDLEVLRRNTHMVLMDTAVFGVAQHAVVPWIAQRAQVDVALFPYYIRPAWMPCPSVTAIHDTISWRVPELFSRQKRWQIRLLHHLAIAGSAHVTTLSHSSAADLAQFYSMAPERITVTSVGVSADFYPRSAAEVNALRERYGLPARYIVYLASDKPHKNIPFLLEAWAAAQTEDVVLVLAGRWFNERTAQLLNQSTLQQRVMRMADVPEADLPTLYSGALALAFPSRYEGFGLPPLEALACGTPVLAANTSSLPEAVGTAGVLLPLELPAWQAALTRICRDAAWRTTLAAHTQAQAARFSWRSAAERLYAALEQVQRR